MTKKFELPKHEIGTILYGVHRIKTTPPVAWMVTGHSLVTTTNQQVDCLLTSLEEIERGYERKCTNISLATLQVDYYVSISLEEAIRWKIDDLTTIISDYNTYINESISKD